MGFVVAVDVDASEVVVLVWSASPVVVVLLVGDVVVDVSPASHDFRDQD